MRESSNEPIVTTEGRDDSIPYSWQETERGVIGFIFISRIDTILFGCEKYKREKLEVNLRFLF